MMFGSTAALSDRLSLLTWLTQIAASAFVITHLSTLLIFIEAASLKPKSEWSVNTTFFPRVTPCRSEPIFKRAVV